MRKKTVFVGLSGGVDSAVSAALLKKAGHEVVGVFMRTWHPEFLPCNEQEERRDAMRVAAHLNIPFLTFDFEEVYKKEVADYMISEYKAGRTPNPDVMCNKHVKFGAFLGKAVAMGADYIATGHYAQVSSFPAKNFLETAPSESRGQGAHTFLKNSSRGNFLLQKSTDLSKDQSYFLWTLTQKQLGRILFPVGHLKKTQVRRLAQGFGLPVAEKKDSQGICFLGAVDLKEFLKHYIKEKKGEVLNKRGETIGYHGGAVFYTLGERHGFTITKKSPNDGAYYVVGKDVKKNVLVASRNSARQGLAKENHQALSSLIRANYRIEQTNWIADPPGRDKKFTAQIRYHGELLPCKVKCGGLASAEVIFEKPVMVAPGQSSVIYDGDVCLGGGIVV